jgi:hypothetical protein
MILFTLKSFADKTMKKHVLSRYGYLFLCLSISSSLCLSGCMGKKQPISYAPAATPQITHQETCQNQLTRALQKNKQLENDKSVLTDEYTQQKDLIAELQTSLLKQHQEADNYLQLTERLVGALAPNNIEPPSTDKQIATAKLVVEVLEVIIGTMKLNTLDNAQKDLLFWAEQYLSESKVEIERENVEGAAYLCRQAMEQVQQFSFYTNTHRAKENPKGITFQSPMPMKLLKKSNLRTAPSIQAKVLKTLNAGSLVSALGYKGQWVHVSLTGQENTTGWIYYSLLH